MPVLDMLWRGHPPSTPCALIPSRTYTSRTKRSNGICSRARRSSAGAKGRAGRKQWLPGKRRDRSGELRSLVCDLIDHGAAQDE